MSPQQRSDLAPPLAGFPGERALLLHQQRGRRGWPAPALWWPPWEQRYPEHPALQVQSEIRQGWRHHRLRLSLREQRPRPHLELAPRAVPLSSAPREAAIGNTLPSGMPHVPGEEVLGSHC